MPETVKQLTPSDNVDERISLLEELTDTILRTDTINSIANKVLDIVVRYIGAGKCSMMLLNDRRELTIVASRGIDHDVSKSYRTGIGHGIAGTVVRHTTPVLVTDIDLDERFQGMGGGEYRTRSFISCPITGNKRMLGILNASDRKDSLPFDEQGFDTMRIISQQTAVALEKALLVERMKKKAAELEEMNRKLMEGDLLKTEFLTRISHELRTPLNSIKGSIYYLESSDKLTHGEQKEFYSIIAKETDKLAMIVEDQLDFLTCDDEMRIVRQSVVSLAEILSEVSCSKTLSERLEREGINLSVQFDQGVQEILGDKFRIIQMFSILLESVASHLKNGDTLRISATESEEVRVTIQVDRELPKSFQEAFSFPDYHFQKDETGQNTKMHLVRKTAENLGWDLIVGTSALTLAIPLSRRQKIDAAMGRSIELFLEFIAEMMGLDTCSIMLRDEATGELKIQSAMGLNEDIVKKTRIRLGDQISGWVALEGKPVLIDDIEQDPRFARKNTPQYNSKSLLSIPLKIQDSVTGVLNLNNKKTAEPFTSQDLTLASVLGARVSHLIERLRSDEGWEESFREFTASFDKLLAAGRKYHKKTRQLPGLVKKIMERLGAAEEEKEIALYVATVYDLGLMFMDDAVLRKSKLDPAEFASLKVHPFNTVELLNSIEFSSEVNRAILHHHEKFDGTGYPDGLAGTDIPLISRVIAVVDAFCAMVSKRPHRDEKTDHDALREIRDGAGSSYDPAVVEALEASVNS
jgi:HD-GYP domain-containing protein (c-di-GMP phosphodiesterase class II)/signal transduction histidine kinase